MPNRPKNGNDAGSPVPEVVAPEIPPEPVVPPEPPKGERPAAREPAKASNRPKTPTLPPLAAVETPEVETRPAATTAWSADQVHNLIFLALAGQVASVLLAVAGMILAFHLGAESHQATTRSGHSANPLSAVRSALLPSDHVAATPVGAGSVATVDPGVKMPGGRVVRTVYAKPTGPTYEVAGIKPLVSYRVHVLGGSLTKEAVFLEDTDVGDADLDVLIEMPEIAYLNLDRTHVTDRGLRKVERLKTLRKLSLVGDPGVTDAGIKRLQKAIPEIEIVRDATP